MQLEKCPNEKIRYIFKLSCIIKVLEQFENSLFERNCKNELEITLFQHPELKNLSEIRKIVHDEKDAKYNFLKKN